MWWKSSMNTGNGSPPEMLLSAQAMKEAVRLLQPLLAESGAEMKGKVVIGAVEGAAWHWAEPGFDGAGECRI